MPEKYMDFLVNPDGTVNIVSEDGTEWGSVPQDKVGEYVSHGWVPMTKDQHKQAFKIEREKRVEEAYDEKNVEAALNGLASGLTFGLSDYLAPDYEKEHTRRLREANPIASTVGEIGSYLLPVGPVGLLGKGTSKVAAKIASKVVQSSAPLKQALSKAVVKGAEFAVEGAAVGASSEISRQALYDGKVSVGKIAKSAAVGAGLNIAFGAAFSSAGYLLKKLPITKTKILEKANLNEERLSLSLYARKEASKKISKIEDAVKASNDNVKNVWNELKTKLPVDSTNPFWTKLNQYADDLKTIENYRTNGGDTINARQAFSRIERIDPQIKVDYDNLLEKGSFIKNSIQTLDDPIKELHNKYFWQQTVSTAYKDIERNLPFSSYVGRRLFPIALGLGTYGFTGDPQTAAFVGLAPFVISRGVGLLSKMPRSIENKTFFDRFLHSVDNLKMAEKLYKTAKISSTKATIDIMSKQEMEKIKKNFNLIEPIDIAMAKQEVLLERGADPKEAQEIANKYQQVLELLKSNVGNRIVFSKIWNAVEDNRNILARLENKKLTSEDLKVLKIQTGKYFQRIVEMAESILETEWNTLDNKTKKMLQSIIGNKDNAFFLQQLSYQNNNDNNKSTKLKHKPSEIPSDRVSKNIGG